MIQIPTNEKKQPERRPNANAQWGEKIQKKGAESWEKRIANGLRTDRHGQQRKMGQKKRKNESGTNWE